MIILILIFIFVFVAGLLLISSFSPAEQQKLSLNFKQDIAKDYKPLLPRKPFAFTMPLLPLNRWILDHFGRRYISALISLAALDMSPEEYLALKEIAALLVSAVLTITLQRFDLNIILIAAIGIMIVPDTLLQMRSNKRKLLAVKALPEVIDLLALCVEGGIDFLSAISWVVKRAPKSPLVDELRVVLHEVSVGRARHEALKGLADRLGVPEVQSFVNILIHSEKMGTPVSEILEMLGDEARRQRYQRGERVALQAPIKMLFPLVFFIMPIVAIIVGGPIFLEFTRGGYFKGF